MCTVVSFVAVDGLTVVGRVLGAVAREKMEKNHHHHFEHKVEQVHLRKISLFSE